MKNQQVFHLWTRGAQGEPLPGMETEGSMAYRAGSVEPASGVCAGVSSPDLEVNCWMLSVDKSASSKLRGGLANDTARVTFWSPQVSPENTAETPSLVSFKERKGTIFQYTRTPCSYQGSPAGETSQPKPDRRRYYQKQTHLGKRSTLSAHCSHPVRDNGGEKLRNTWELTVQRNRLTQTLRLVIGLQNAALPPHLTTILLKIYLQQFLLPSTSHSTIKKKLPHIAKENKQTNNPSSPPTHTFEETEHTPEPDKTGMLKWSDEEFKNSYY